MPGPWLRLTAVAAAASTGVAVVSGAAGGGVAHEALSAIAVPPLVVLVLAAWLEYRRLLVPTSTALVLFGVAALVTGRVPHIVLAALAFAASSSRRRSSCESAGYPPGPGATTWR